MRRFLISSVILLFVLVTIGACSRSAEPNNLKVGSSVTVTMKDGSVVTGRVVEARADQLVIDPFEGGEWKTLPRAQIASVAQTDAGNTQGTPGAAPAPAAGETAAAPTPEAPATQPPAAGSRSARPSGRRAAGTPGQGLSERHDAPAASNAPPRAEFREVTVPANTLLHVRLNNPVASDTSHVEDVVRASLSKAVTVEGDEVLPAGSELRGVVTDARPSGKVKGVAGVAFRFDTVEADGQQYRVRTQGVEREAEATKKKDAMKIGIPAAGGAIIGGILGGKKGAVIGGAAGGGAGTAVVLTTPGKELRLPAGTALTVRLLEPLTLRVPVNR